MVILISSNILSARSPFRATFYSVGIGDDGGNNTDPAIYDKNHKLWLGKITKYWMLLLLFILVSI